MKAILKIGFLSLLLLIETIPMQAQKKCKVLKKEIADSYTGRCKKGFANGKGKAVGIDTYTGHFKKGLPDGKGTYIWKNGDQYTGHWKNGFRSGEGTMHLRLNGSDTTLAGLWKEDRYMGPIPPKPKVLISIGVDRYNFQKSKTNRNRVLIDMYLNGLRNVEIENLIMTSSSGSDTRVGNSVGYEFVKFPVEIKVTYLSWNKLRTAKYYVEFQFVISEPGDWRVTIDN